ncbi:hypothetical protein LTA00_13165 [Lactiplantibacillus plantarum]|uniref:hypothetical protein n=1 Tax=Lactiplantibacillus plantarum TaxID=1590 RepID=UPI0020052E1B|nr:hypothetical protein [Lactiplantibacillus plantarum]MCK6240530.1 hypothetical protein [Lactiplantibacillus plantarum]
MLTESYYNDEERKDAQKLADKKFEDFIQGLYDPSHNESSSYPNREKMNSYDSK